MFSHMLTSFKSNENMGPYGDNEWKPHLKFLASIFTLMVIETVYMN